MASKVDIFRAALSAVGAGDINAADEKSTEAATCRIHWALVQPSILRAYDWSFASFHRALSLVTNSEDNTAAEHPFLQSYAYAYPSDCLAFREILNPMAGLPPIDYSIGLGPAKAARLILTDQADAVGRYTVLPENEALYDPSFVMYAAHVLGAAIALPLGKDEKKRQELLKSATELLGVAQASDMNEVQFYRGDDEPAAFRARY